MSTAGQFSRKNPTVKRIMKEAAELASQPSADYAAAPLETDIFEWHFTLRGAPSPSPFESGLYHGRIVLPPAYPLKPPSFRFLTPTGRFEVNREICLSISGHHEETWQPAWGIRTALVAIRSFMDTDARGQLGGMDSTDEVRRRLASQSPAWTCPVCAKSNGEIMREHGGEAKTEEVPEELRLAYREDINKKTPSTSAQDGERRTTTKPKDPSAPDGVTAPAPASTNAQSDVLPADTAGPRPSTTSTTTQFTNPAQQRQTVNHPLRDNPIPPWIDKAILGVIAAIVFLLYQRYLL